MLHVFLHMILLLRCVQGYSEKIATFEPVDARVEVRTGLVDPYGQSVLDPGAGQFGGHDKLHQCIVGLLYLHIVHVVKVCMERSPLDLLHGVQRTVYDRLPIAQVWTRV